LEYANKFPPIICRVYFHALYYQDAIECVTEPVSAGNCAAGELMRSLEEKNAGTVSLSPAGDSGGVTRFRAAQVNSTEVSDEGV